MNQKNLKKVMKTNCEMARLKMEASIPELIEERDSLKDQLKDVKKRIKKTDAYKIYKEEVRKLEEEYKSKIGNES